MKLVQRIIFWWPWYVLIAWLALAVIGRGQETKPSDPNPKTYKLSKEEGLELQLWSARVELLNRDRDDLMRRICDTRKLPIDRCILNPQQGTVMERPEIIAPKPAQKDGKK